MKDENNNNDFFVRITGVPTSMIQNNRNNDKNFEYEMKCSLRDMAKLTFDSIKK